MRSFLSCLQKNMPAISRRQQHLRPNHKTTIDAHTNIQFLNNFFHLRILSKFTPKLTKRRLPSMHSISGYNNYSREVLVHKLNCRKLKKVIRLPSNMQSSLQIY
eukprot:TRINITY_DN2395_c0_g1_i12.p2 TRINITY_DN2395_c0_g1~~TRINITY_DN2395_c0_g1_i12.p2  ORF type:complete len:104 (+),score=13.00 TRINITY_DN2395_c0_g1_i12:606-917(+)